MCVFYTSFSPSFQFHCRYLLGLVLLFFPLWRGLAVVPREEKTRKTELDEEKEIENQIMKFAAYTNRKIKTKMYGIRGDYAVGWINEKTTTTYSRIYTERIHTQGNKTNEIVLFSILSRAQDLFFIFCLSSKLTCNFDCHFMATSKRWRIESEPVNRRK